MKSPYVPDKTLDELSSTWRLPINMRSYLDIYVWNTRDGMYDNCHFRNRGKYLGCYIGIPGRKQSGLFGEIHLVRDMIGAGYVAHEITHFVYDYLFFSIDKFATIDSERFAKITGDVTNRFWTEFYNRYEEKSGNK